MVACAALLVACAPRMSALPSRGGPAWLEVASAHFTLWTDAGPRRGEALIRALELRRLIVARAMSHVQAEQRTFVIALHDQWETDAYLRDRMSAMALFGNPSALPAVVISADRHSDYMVGHVLTNVISRGIVRRQPVWLTEGIATYFEMADLTADAETVKVGLPRAGLLRVLARKRTLGVGELMACDYERPCLDDRLYATAWALFSYLVNEKFDQLTAYMAALDHLAPDEAWAEAFGALSVGELDTALERWLVNGELRVPRIAVPQATFPTATRALADADVLAVRGMLELSVKRNGMAARTISDAALAADRTNVLARMVHRALGTTPSPEDARATAAAHPDDWRAWLLVALAAGRGPELREAYARICKLAPERTNLCPARTAGR